MKKKPYIKQYVSIRALARRATCSTFLKSSFSGVSIRALARRATFPSSAPYFKIVFQFVPSRGGQQSQF